MPKMFCHFSKVFADHKFYINNKGEICQNKSYDYVISSIKPLTRQDVIDYFVGSRHPGLDRGQYCDRCFILISDKNIVKKYYMWNNFYLCPSCHDDKVLGLEEAIPDLEDLKRFNVNLNNYVPKLYYNSAQEKSRAWLDN